MAVEPSPAEMAARSAIGDVITLYCHLLDRRRWERMVECFHPQATYRFATIIGGWSEFVDMARAGIDPLRISHHQIGNIQIRVTGDKAVSETYFTARHRVAADTPSDALFPGTGHEYETILAGRYIDQFERRDGDWRIVHRTGVTDWRFEAPASDAGLFDQPPEWRGSVGPDDPALIAFGGSAGR